MNDSVAADLTQMVHEFQTFLQSALADKTADSFESLEQRANRFDSFIREMQQVRHANEARAAIRRLEGRDALTDVDRDTIRDLVVGDAAAYLKQENNLKDWLAELQRLGQRVQELSSRADDESVRELRGVVKDAVRLLPNIRSYMEEKQRLDRFNAAIANLDADNRRLLADLLREMMSSTTR